MITNLEKDIVLFLSKPNKNDELLNFFKEKRINKNNNWWNILTCLIYNKTISMFWYNIQYIDKKNIPNQVRKVAEAKYLYNKFRNLSLISEMKKLSLLLKKNNIDNCIIKGGAIINSLYPCLGTREMDDIDILVKKNKVVLAKEVLIRNGYIQGDLDRKKNQIIPKRKQYMEKRNAKLHAIYPLRKIGNNEFVSNFEIDLCWDIIPPKGREFFQLKHNVGSFIDKSYLSDGYYIPSTFDQFLILSIHLFGHAMATTCIHDFKDILLCRFLDIYLFIKNNYLVFNLSNFINIVNKYKLNKPIYYTLKTVSLLWPDISYSVAPLIEKLGINDISLLNKSYSYLDIKNECKYWDDNIVDRLLNLDRFNNVSINKSAIILGYK